VLLGVGDREPVFDELDAGADQHALEFRSTPEEFRHLFLGAEAHDPLDAGAVVTGTVEQHDLAGSRQMWHIALEIPLAALALAGCGQRYDPGNTRIEPLSDAFDDLALARCIAALEDHDHLLLGGCHPVLQLDEFALQPEQLLEVESAIEPGAGKRRFMNRPVDEMLPSSFLGLLPSSRAVAVDLMR
jgi:hypothetical protein